MATNLPSRARSQASAKSGISQLLGNSFDEQHTTREQQRRLGGIQEASRMSPLLLGQAERRQITADDDPWRIGRAIAVIRSTPMASVRLGEWVVTMTWTRPVALRSK